MDLTELNNMNLTEVSMRIEQFEKLKKTAKTTLQSTQTELDLVRKDIAHFAVEKRKVLDLFVIGAATQKDVDRVKDTLKVLKEKEIDLTDVLDATERALADLKTDLPQLLDRKIALTRRLWSQIFEEQAGQLRVSPYRDQILNVLAVADLAGKNWNHPRFIAELFFDGGTAVVSEIERFKPDLQAKYLG